MLLENSQHKGMFMRCDPPEAVNRIFLPLVSCAPSWATLICMINEYLNALRILRIQRDIRVVGVELLTSRGNLDFARQKMSF